jgi:lipid-binding SYLF domain-containing protein
MKLAKTISALGVLAMTTALTYGFIVGDFGSDGTKLMQNSWGMVSMVDLYTGSSYSPVGSCTGSDLSFVFRSGLRQ